jgi:hypothetical protein
MERIASGVWGGRLAWVHPDLTPTLRGGGYSWFRRRSLSPSRRVLAGSPVRCDMPHPLVRSSPVAGGVDVGVWSTVSGQGSQFVLISHCPLS